MPRVDEEGKVAKAVVAFKQWLPAVKPLLQERYAPVREAPRLLWTFPEVRYPAYVIGALLTVWLVRSSIRAVNPVPESQMQPLATTGDFQVLCTNEQCGEEFVINRPFKFDDFPVDCPRCHQKTGCRALRCYSKTCRGLVVPTDIIRGNSVCRRCNQIVKK